MTTPLDFRDQEPVWVKYLTWVSDKHDKFYEVRIDLGDDGLFYVTKRWGARPDVGGGQTKIESSMNMSYVQRVANEKVAEKVRKGYAYTDRPESASSKVAKDFQEYDL